jgi:hypothetical protein
MKKKTILCLIIIAFLAAILAGIYFWFCAKNQKVANSNIQATVSAENTINPDVLNKYYMDLLVLEQSIWDPPAICVLNGDLNPESEFTASVQYKFEDKDIYFNCRISDIHKESGKLYVIINIKNYSYRLEVVDNATSDLINDSLLSSQEYVVGAHINHISNDSSNKLFVEGTCFSLYPFKPYEQRPNK